MTEQQKHFPEFYVTAPQPCPYLAGRQERKLFTHLTHEKPASVIDNLLRGGFRRSQNIAYMPYCEGCQACVSIRLVIDELHIGRSMRRTLDKGRCLDAKRVPPEPTSEQFALFRHYIDTRHSDGGMADMTVLDYAMMVEDSVINTFVTEYRRKPEDPLDTDVESWPLVAVALCDLLSDGISMVYSFYDPDIAHSSLGTYMILEHAEYTRSLGLPYLYLGYWIDGSPKMNYKMRFQPQERLGPNGWVRV
ncbi:Arginine-tRNA-protein transferase [Hyphomicrobium sulfonivorans]|uniref:Aspartate/glutamate leucyltransferase n=1 Tax=Hyphomicrobium sulfonivorans TaxID=121290 RepID=A0A109BJ52_HYPSL|nr:arginyltransferase [Hyphomicrobium sulfonivorans]KWT69455.1 Arginine-tRNA-protein transferase [Hyphomicrobium sulfonivorans]